MGPDGIQNSAGRTGKGGGNLPGRRHCVCTSEKKHTLSLLKSQPSAAERRTELNYFVRFRSVSNFNLFLINFKNILEINLYIKSVHITHFI